jgi:hypothetical protein
MQQPSVAAADIEQPAGLRNVARKKSEGSVNVSLLRVRIVRRVQPLVGVLLLVEPDVPRRGRKTTP